MTKMMQKFPISHMAKNNVEISYISYMTNMMCLTSPDKKAIKKIRILIRSTHVRHF